MAQYRQAHRHPYTRLTHLVGIPLIVLSVPVLLLSAKLAATLFAVGWTLQLIGHYVFEKNDPQFFGDRRNLVVGVIWSGIEWSHILRRRRNRRNRRTR